VSHPEFTPEAADRFPTTHWSYIVRARDPAARPALEALCRAYWFPIYAFARRKGLDPDAAEDLVQGLFARLLDTGDLVAVDPQKGRFRSFLMAACSHYLANRRDFERAARRGGGRAPLAIDRLDAEGRYGREPAHGLTAERLFERRWAMALLDRALDRLAAEAADAGKRPLFEQLRPALLGEADATPYARVAEAVGLSVGAVKVAAHRLRRRCGEVIRQEVARTVDDPADIDDEISRLLGALARGSGG
jgi:RNA polymerase sigma-70 factor (ECF subfamily)